MTLGSNGRQLRVGLYVTCLANLFRPSVAFAAVKLLERAGCVLQVCCGRPAWSAFPGA